MRLSFVLVFSLLAVALSAQEPSRQDLKPCGTPAGIDPWLKAYVARPETAVNERSSDTLYAGLQIHLLAKDNGSGRFSPEKLLTAFCQLNADYAASGIRFFFKGDWNSINNTLWYQHTTIPQGIDMMLTNNVDGALNIYFGSKAAGNCGYNLPYAGISLSHACAGTGTHTWAHEVGHALSLPHPFIGWEDTNYSTLVPTPLKLTYNYTYFHDTIDTQVPAPLDTALVEFLDGSNCQIAADLFCDTKPDYLSNIWTCDGQGNSTQKQFDPAGAQFYSDGTLFMSYSSDECQNRFSGEQTAAMRANLLSEKAAWFADTPAEEDITASPELLVPSDGENVPQTGAVLSWSAVPHATHYLLQYSRIVSFQVKDFELVTTDTSYTIAANLLANKTYYWRVRPFNHWYACTPFSEQQSFVTVPPTDVTQPDGNGWRCYPSLLTQGQAITLELQENWLNKKSHCAVYDATGRQMWRTSFTPSGPRVRLSPPSAAWPQGVYRLVFTGENGVKTQTLVLTSG